MSQIFACLLFHAFCWATPSKDLCVWPLKDPNNNFSHNRFVVSYALLIYWDQSVVCWSSIIDNDHHMLSIWVFIICVCDRATFKRIIIVVLMLFSFQPPWTTLSLQIRWFLVFHGVVSYVIKSFADNRTQERLNHYMMPCNITTKEQEADEKGCLNLAFKLSRIYHNERVFRYGEKHCLASRYKRDEGENVGGGGRHRKCITQTWSGINYFLCLLVTRNVRFHCVVEGSTSDGLRFSKETAERAQDTCTLCTQCIHS